MSLEKRIRLFLICFLLIFSAIGEAKAASYYISPTGSDSYNCSISYPCKTIENASNRLIAGDTLYLRGGTYLISSGAYLSSSIAGTAQLPITITHYPGETAILSGNGVYWSGLQIVNYSGRRYLVIDGLEFDRFQGIAIQANRASNLTIRNCYFHDGKDNGAGVIEILDDQGAAISDFLIENNIFENNGRTIATNQDHDVYIARGASNVIIRNNYFKNSSGGAAVHIYSGSSMRPHDVSIYNNIFYLTRGLNRLGIQIYSPGTGEIYNTSVYNNTIYMNCSGATAGCIAVDYRSGTGTNNTFKNNIIYMANKGNDTSVKYSPSLATFDYNLYYPTKDENDTGTHSFAGNPLFVNIGTQDFYISASSPAINRGVTLGTVTTDYDGVPRAQGTAYDIGAYEFTGSTSVTTPSVNSAPLASMNVNSITNYTVSITDTSTDNAAFPTSAITVNWGDGAISTGNNRATFSHAYAIAATFIITLTARDAGGLYDDSVPQNVTVPQNVSTAPVAVMKVNSITSYTVSITDASTDNAAFPTSAITVNWGDGATSTGNNRATFSHTYATIGTFKITLTAKDAGGLSSSVVQYVAVTLYVNEGPEAVMTVNSIIGYTVSITDASTDNAAFPSSAITVDWGDGATSTGNNRATFSHAYTTTGTFNILLTAIDAGGLSSSVLQNVAVTIVTASSLSISGKVVRLNGTTPIVGASMYLYGGPSVKLTTTATDGTYIFANLSPGSYTVKATKSSVTFVDKSVVVTNASVTGVIFTADR